MSAFRVHFIKPGSRGISFHRYPEAKKFQLATDGGLFVLDSSGKGIGVYAPGNWTDAYFEDSIGEPEQG
ncbi:hypothetical protein CVN56_21230 [Rhodococcus sp. AQ5-07]|nr:hypothetical protein CVN56_21230 [Rhodococcus sp. AQ5-07]